MTDTLSTARLHPTTMAYVAARCFAVTTVHRLRSEQRGEGVISVAIAVLIMAFLGAAMWLAFQEIFNSAATNTENQVNKIGQ